jgi:hypothetical protein
VVFTHGNPADPSNGLVGGQPGYTEQSFQMALIELVTAALTDPGGASLETFVPPVPGPVGG